MNARTCALLTLILYFCLSVFLDAGRPSSISLMRSTIMLSFELSITFLVSAKFWSFYCKICTSEHSKCFLAALECTKFVFSRGSICQFNFTKVVLANILGEVGNFCTILLSVPSVTISVEIGLYLSWPTEQKISWHVFETRYIYTVSGKRCHFIFDYNCRISWSIFKTFIPLETTMNIP